MNDALASTAATAQPVKPKTAELPPRPRLTLRIGFAGNRELPADPEPLAAALTEVIRLIGRRLAEIAPGTLPCAKAGIARFYAPEAPVLRLVTGLAEGADALAAQTLDRAADGDLAGLVETELAAVLPFDLAAYRDSRPAEFHPEFDAQASRCAYVLTLDGHYEKPAPDTDLAKKRRARAYRAQSAVLLRHCDVLLAVANPDEPGRAGGSLETVRAALAFELPVAFIHALTGGVWLIEPRQDLVDALTSEPAPDWQKTLRAWITTIVADPGAAPEPAPNDTAPRPAPEGTSAHGATPADHGAKRLKEYFYSPAIPPTRIGKDGKSVRRPSHRERCWSWFEQRFRKGEDPKSDPRLKPYDRWRDRATRLNYHYVGLYRGAFLLNYALAVVAVMLAAFSLVLLGLSGTCAPWLVPALFCLGGLKLTIVGWIFRNTHQANDGAWSDKAVDYRYLAERLRAMYYLPRIGSFQPPAAAPPRYASRVVHQSAVDWLFDAVVRSISPAELCQPARSPGNGGKRYEAPIIDLNALNAIALLEDLDASWIAQQIVYHKRNRLTMSAMHRFAEKWGIVLSVAVIGFVAVDLAALTAELLHWLPDGLSHRVHLFAPWLVFLAAVLPAAVASLNGIRFQSECRRLADRSDVMRKRLEGHRAEARRLLHRIRAARAQPSTDPGAWSVEVLRLTEAIARDFVEEVAEWSVLYAKEVFEQG